MGAKSRIEWTDATWTPIRARRRDTRKVGVHCERVSEACRNCYAATFNRRSLPVHGTGLDFTRDNREKVEIFVDEKLLLAPLRWKRPRRIFVCSQTDLFGEFVPDEAIDRVFAVMALCPQHTFQLLTKRPERMLKWFSRPLGHMNNVITLMTSKFSRELFGGRYAGANIPFIREQKDSIVTFDNGRWPLPHLWVGVTGEDQPSAEKRIEVLLRTPAAVRFLSAEPLLGPLDIRKYLARCKANRDGECSWSGCPQVADGEPQNSGRHCPIDTWGDADDDFGMLLDWVIAGGESGPGARPSNPDWFRSLRDQCVAAGVPFFHKQNGEWFPAPMWNPRRPPNQQLALYPDGSLVDDDANPDIVGAQRMIRVGKAAAGRLLDGVEWSQFPEARR